MRKITDSKKGTALFMAMLAVLIMSGLTLLMVKRGTIGMKDTIGVRNTQSAFTAAEAGIEHARKLLNDGASTGDTILGSAEASVTCTGTYPGTSPYPTWDDELTCQAGADGVMGTADDINFIDNTDINSKQSYSVRIVDNVDVDLSLLVDADGRIWVISTGVSFSKSTSIRALMENDAQDEHIAQEHYGEQSLGHAKGEGKNVAGQIRGNL